ncbi:MAG: transposase [Candidatus Vogelbacteria bacterium]|nr:transposase [Candidatus Vogelbacteria bacterium]
MPYRPIPFAVGEYFHLVNRGNLKCAIFKDDADRARFLFYLLYFQSPESFDQIGRYTKKFLKTGDFGFNEKEIREIISKRLVKVIAFSLMPNHFHILVQSSVDDGVSIYMQKVLNGYTKYFNAKYQQSGHLFQGPFRAVHIKDNEQLLYTSAYIHLNPKDVQHRVLDILEYRWSSFSDFVGQNRWEQLLDPSIILEQIAENNDDYKNWVETSGAKEFKDGDLDFE